MVFSTGPLENQIPNKAALVLLKAENVDLQHTAVVLFRIFMLNGERQLLFEIEAVIPPNGSFFHVFFFNPADPVMVGITQYEVQAVVTGREPDKVLLSVIGEDIAGEAITTQTVLASQFVLISG